MRCLDSVAFPEVRRFLRVAKWVYKVGQGLEKDCYSRVRCLPNSGRFWSSRLATVTGVLNFGLAWSTLEGFQLHAGDAKFQLAEAVQSVAGTMPRRPSAHGETTDKKAGGALNMQPAPLLSTQADYHISRGQLLWICPLPGCPSHGRLVRGEQSHSRSVADVQDPLLRPCQVDCLYACGKGARIIEMACGTGKTRVIKELVANVSGRVSRLISASVDLWFSSNRTPASQCVGLRF